ncbi:chemotaxis protein MotA [Paenibacillus sp. J31TS4]|uniref:flagellar motor protein MotB n=1 Tax=Paenibacillus sp. J31TS4 TaxID=2807195 RepID=UPI001B11A081|nr:flagellar motor protein MotB [Paenibacillus sp. J31TS4]GIP41014.1 chemotaxis protein MotA [Paenibacillus sp. J31TS4]
MPRRAKKKNAEHENSERWLITYSDLITLLLIFFVIMYAMSKVDVAKYSMLATSLQHQFRQADSALPAGSGIIGGLDLSKGTQGREKEANEHTEKEEQDKKEKELQDLLKVVNQYISDNQLQANVSALDTRRGIAITLNDLVLFDLGRADIKAPAYPVLEKLATLFPTLHTTISIEGHTDNLPIVSSSPFRDNWRLSSERSLSVLRYFTEKANLPASMFQSIAYADTKPVAPNTSDENRQRNRRVEIVVLR